jgi:hypothetical protein
VFVLEEQDAAGDALSSEPLLGLVQQALHDALPALSWITRSVMSSHSGVAYSG